MTETSTYYAGIDVAKDRLDVVLRPSGRYMQATNDERGIRSVVRRLREENVALAVLEATGGLEQPAAVALALADVPVANSSTRGRSRASPGPRASSPRPTGSMPRCSPTLPRRSGHSRAPWATNTPANSRPWC